MYTKRSTVMLYCLVLGDIIEKSFLVEVNKDLSVSVLREIIKEKTDPRFKDTPANDLILWKVNISVDNVDPETKICAEEQLTKENKLSTFQVVGSYFDDEEALSSQRPNNHVIRIVIHPDYAVGQKRHAYLEPELEPKRQKTLPDPFDFGGFVNQLSNKVKVYSPPELYPESKQGIAGRFRKPGSCIPISGEKFPDMRLNDKNITAMGEKLVGLCKNEKRDFQLLYAVSGAGKTRAIFDMAMHENGLFITYIECRPSSDEKSIILESTLDRNFAQLVSSIESEFARTKMLNIEQAREESKRLITLEYATRVLYLLILSKKFENITPHDYLLAQIDGGQKCITKIKDELKGYDKSDLEFLFRSALEFLEDNLLNKVGQKSLVFAIDEANVASTKIDTLNGQFKNRHGKTRGLLTPMLEVLDLFEVSMVIAGTAFSLKQGSNIQSDIGKGQEAEYLVDFKFMKSEDVQAYITQYLDLSECNTCIIKNWKFLTGRPRLAARLVSEVIHAEQNLKTKSKQEVLETAVDNTVHVVRKAMEKHLKNIVTDTFGKNDFSNVELQGAFEKLFINCRFFGGCVSIKMNDNSSKLVDCGIALLKPGINNYLEVKEPLAVKVVNTILGSKYTPPTKALIMSLLEELKQKIADSNFDKNDTAKCFIWQYLVLARLIDFKGETVHDFVNKFYKTQAQLPNWTKDAIINIELFGNKTILSMLDNALKDVDDDVDVVNKLLWGKSTTNKLLVPSQSMRPDGLFIGKGDINTYWTFLISAKFRSENLPKGDFETDFRSTNWELVYYKVNGNEVNCSNLRAKLNTVCNGFNHCGSIRVHFIYPGVASGRGGFFVQGNDVIMYIDKTLLRHYFEETYADLLETILFKSKK